MPLQPVDLPINLGIFLSVGVVTNDDRVEVVFPLSTDDAALDSSITAHDAVVSFETLVLPSFQACISDDAHVAFLSAVGFVPGGIPYRRDYGPTTHPGLGGLNPMPSNVTGLILFYAEPDDLGPGQRMRVGKTFMPAVPDPEVDGNIIQPTLSAAYSTLGTLLAGGWDTDGAGGKWYRVCSDVPRVADPDDVIRTGAMVVRNYVATQRRRLVPH